MDYTIYTRDNEILVAKNIDTVSHLQDGYYFERDGVVRLFVPHISMSSYSADE